MTDLVLVPELEREQAHRAAELEHRDPMVGRVAIAITLTTPLGAATGYLERLAATHQASADRKARVYSVRAVSEAIAADVVLRERRTLRTAYREAGLLADELAESKSSYAKLSSAAYQAASRDLQTLANGFFGPRSRSTGFDSVSFVEDQELARYSAAEWQKAYAEERGSWASKRGGLIFAVGVLRSPFSCSA